MAISAGVLVAGSAVAAVAHGAPEQPLAHTPEHTSASSLWQAMGPVLRTQLGDDQYDSWLGPLAAQGWHGGVLTLGAPTAMFAQHVQTHFLATLQQVAGQLAGQPAQVQLAICTPQAVRRLQAQGAPQGAHTGAHSAAPGATQPAGPQVVAGPWLSGARLDERYTFSQFVMGKSNQFAFTAAQSIANALIADGKPQYNPFFLHGGVGLGKTHLMHAIGHALLEARPSTRVLYLTAEQFLHHFVKAIREKNTFNFKELYRNVDVLMIDDVQFIAGKDATQEEFFHTFNTLVSQGKQIVLTADRPPATLPDLEERLKSRLGSGLTLEVHAPEEETRLAILQLKATSMGTAVPPEVLQLLASHVATNVRELEGALNRLVAFHRLTGTPLSVELAQDQLRDLFRAYVRQITLEDIQQKTATHFNIRLADMHSPRRAREVARPRQVAMYLAKQLTSKSYPEIGRAFGGRDHTTVIHACETVEALMPRDATLAENVTLLTRQLQGRA